MKQIAQGLAALGRGEDKMLVHMTPKEVAGLQQLALAHGGSLTVHPQTGLPEAGFLSNILPTLVGVGLSFVPGMQPWAAGLIAGGLETARTGNLGKGVMAGLGAYAGAGLGQAGMETIGTQAAQQTAQQAAQQAAPAALEGVSAFNPGQVTAALPQAAPTASISSGLPPNYIEAENLGLMRGATPASLPPISAPTPAVADAASLADNYANTTASRPTFAQALANQFPSTGSKVAAGIGGLGALGAFEQPGLKLPAPTQTSNARLSGPVRRPYDQNAPQGYYFTDRGILQPAYAAGGGVGGDGIAALAKGGQYLDGPGDGMSDSIPATIAGKQPARLADGEFVVPADVVSHLGNGSSKAGAKRLYAMMDKVRHARTGTKKQGKEINAEKYLPA